MTTLRQFNKALRRPVRHPALYDGVRLHVRRVVAVWAPAGSGKCTAVHHYCLHAIGLKPEYVAVVRAGRDHPIPLAKIVEQSAVTIIEHAENLAFERVHESYALKLHAIAAAKNSLIVCLFDSVALAPGPFLAQFAEANIYFPPPDSAFVIAMLRNWMQWFNNSELHKNIVHFDMDAMDYASLADLHTKDASPADLVVWMQSVMHEVLQQHEDEGSANRIRVTLPTLCEEPFMSTRAQRGGPYILPVSPHYELNKFADMAGLGPAMHVAPRLVAPNSSASAASAAEQGGLKKKNKKKKKRVEEEEEEQEEEQAEEAPPATQAVHDPAIWLQ